MLRKTIYTIVAMLIFTSSIFCQSENKLAHVNVNNIYYLLPEIDSINQVLDTETAELAGILEDMQLEHRQLTESLDAEYKDATEFIRKTKMTEISDMEKRIQQFSIEAQNKIKMRNQELAIPIFNKVNLAIEKVAKQENLLYVFDISRNQLVYVSDQAISIDKLVKMELGLLVFE